MHLGMSGSLSFGAAAAEPGPHDHFDLVTARGTLRLTDPRRFGAVVWSPAADAAPAATLLAGLGLEPFDRRFDGAASARRAAPAPGRVKHGAARRRDRRRRRATSTPARRCSRPASTRARAATASAGRAPRARRRRCARRWRARVELGGSTLRDFRDAHGAAGEFQLDAQVYGRAGEPCIRCGDADPAHRPGGQRDLLLPGVPAPLTGAGAWQRSRCASTSERAVRRRLSAVVRALVRRRWHRISAPFAPLDDATHSPPVSTPSAAGAPRWANASTTLAPLPRRARPAHGAAAEQIAALRERLGNEKLVRRLRRRVLARQVGADQRHLLRRHRPAHPAGDAGAHDDVPGRARLARRRAGVAAAAADRDPPRGPLARRAARPAARLAPPRARHRRRRPARAVAARGDAHRVGHRGAGARARLLGRRTPRRQPAARRRRQGRGAGAGATR